MTGAPKSIRARSEIQSLSWVTKGFFLFIMLGQRTLLHRAASGVGDSNRRSLMFCRLAAFSKQAGPISVPRKVNDTVRLKVIKEGRFESPTPDAALWGKVLSLAAS